MSGGKKLAFLGLLFAAGVGIAFALHRGPAPPHSEPGEPGAAAEGRVPRRIVVATPSLVECVYALGAGDRVVGVSGFATYPPQARAVAGVGGQVNPRLDRILALRPDLLVVQGEAEKLADFARQHAIPTLHLAMDSIEEVCASLRRLGAALGCEPQAERLVARIRYQLAAVRLRVAGRPRPRVFLCTGHTPGSLRSLSTAGGGTFLSQLLGIAGGRNVFSDVGLPYPTVSKDQLVERAPEVIVELRPPMVPGRALSAAARRQLVADWARLPSLPAVRERHIHVLTDDFLLIPGPRMALTAERLAEVLHPDAEPPDAP
ncbi:MAG: ABC transporter substrate-binding protein [Candidatus Brocadiia bacterium]